MSWAGRVANAGTPVLDQLVVPNAELEIPLWLMGIEHIAFQVE